MAYALAIGSVSFLIALILGKPLVGMLRKYKVGKHIRLDGPSTHSVKAGTPTMGGILIFLTVFLVTAPFNVIGRLSILLPLGMIVSCGILGAIDDYFNIIGKNGSGMTARFKMAWLILISVVASFVLYFFLDLSSIYIPLVGKFDIGLWYLPVATFIIVSTSHAVNLTDGLDTLAGGTSALAFCAYGIIAYLQGQPQLVTFSFTVAGAILGFLWFNSHPAQVFMGDTGSLALGATLATVALMTGQWLLLPIVGLVFVLDTGSVILQVAYFKVSGGKRIFKMAPLHHHFELLGWSETQVTMRFWLIGMMAAMVGVALALI